MKTINSSFLETPQIINYFQHQAMINGECMRKGRERKQNYTTTDVQR